MEQQKQKATPRWLLENMLQEERERNAKYDYLVDHLMSGFNGLVCKLTNTKLEPCDCGDPRCPGDLSDEAVAIMMKVRRDEMKLYAADEVNALKMTVEEGREIKRDLFNDLAMVLGVELKPCCHDCPGHLPKEADDFLRGLRESKATPRDHFPFPWKVWLATLQGKMERWYQLRANDRTSTGKAEASGSPKADTPGCPGSGRSLGWARPEAGLCSCPVCGARGLVAEFRPNPPHLRGIDHYAVPSHSPATAPTEPAGARSEAEVGVGTSPAPEAPGAASTEPWSGIGERAYRKWLDRATAERPVPSIEGYFEEGAKEAYGLGVARGREIERAERLVGCLRLGGGELAYVGEGA